MKTIFAAHHVYTPTKELENAFISVEDGRITQVRQQSEAEIPAGASVFNFGDAILAPGFLDIHIHGGAGVDAMRAPASEMARLGKFLASHGVTGYFPTTVAAPMDKTFAALERLADAIESEQDGDPAMAKPLGIHLEGPFLSHKRRGVHPPENLVAPTVEIFDHLWQAARSHVRMMTIAPELPGALEVIAEAARRKVCVSIGHSDAEMPIAQQAVQMGARHATHTFNAMRPLDHRDPGILGEVLTDNSLSADIIADGIHLSPAVVQIFLKSKGAERAVLITDAISATGMPDGRYLLGPIEVDVKDGRCTSGGGLAGSVLTMDRAVRNLTQFSDWTLRDAVRAATLNAAQAIGTMKDYGTLAPGAEANFVVLSGRGEVLKTIVGGRESQP
jgi:N-acetylglucosamine-6-phosphate deacetylase